MTDRQVAAGHSPTQDGPTRRDGGGPAPGRPAASQERSSPNVLLAVLQRCGPVPCDCDEETQSRYRESVALSPAILSLQRSAGNAAVARALARDRRPVVQRDPPTSFPFTLPDRLRFTDRVFDRPVLCPSCHQPPRDPIPDAFRDRDATEERLDDWARERGRELQADGTLYDLARHPGEYARVVDELGGRLIRGVLTSHAFEGSPPAREAGAGMLRRRWPGIAPAVTSELLQWHQQEVAQAVLATPAGASLVTDPAALTRLDNTPYGHRLAVGRIGAVATVGLRWGNLVIDDIFNSGYSAIWFHLDGRPQWRYLMSGDTFIRTDPLITEVSRQVVERTRFAAALYPLLIRGLGVGMSFSPHIALVIAGIAMEELAEEMQREQEGRPGRSGSEILGSAALSLLVDRVFHHLGAPSAGGAAGVEARLAQHVERTAERAAPAIRRELAQAERPLVEAALRDGGARQVTDRALVSEGYRVEVDVLVAGERHTYRLARDGTWCRFTTRICGVDLGQAATAAATSPGAITRSQLTTLREGLAAAQSDVDFLRSAYERVRQTGRMDLSVLPPDARTRLSSLAPTGDAADLTLAELRDLPRTLDLQGELARGARQETQLVDQLRREGRPLYETMRAASPNHASRTAALRTSGGRDVASGLLPRTGVLNIDHVVPVREIIDLPGFRELRFEHQLAIVNDARNLCAIDAVANRSKSDWPWSMWPQALLHYDAATVSRMRALEAELRAHLTSRIQALGGR